MKNSQPAIKKDLAILQKRITSIDHDLKKQLSVAQSHRKDYEAAGEARDHINEKRKIMHATHATLKRDIHTRKQNHKMNIVS